MSGPVGPVGGAGELTALVELLHKRLDVFEIAAKNHLYQRDVLSVVAAVRPIVDELAALAAKAPQGVADKITSSQLQEFARLSKTCFDGGNHLFWQNLANKLNGFFAATPVREAAAPVSDDTIHQGMVPAPVSTKEKGASMQDSQIKYMVDRFLSWKLPENFNPDGGIIFKKFRNENTVYSDKNKPIGTNLLDAVQAEAMVRYIVDGIDTLRDRHASAERVRRETIEEIATFAETHYCIINDKSPGGYKTETREKHPNEPFARAIRALPPSTGEKSQ